MSTRTHTYKTTTVSSNKFLSTTNLKRLAGFTVFTLLLGSFALNIGSGNGVKTSAEVSVGSSSDYSFCNLATGVVLSGSPTTINLGVITYPAYSAAFMTITKTADVSGGLCLAAKSKYVIVPSYALHNTSFDLDSSGNPINLVITNNTPTYTLASTTTIGGITTNTYTVSDVDLDQIVYPTGGIVQGTKGTTSRISGTSNFRYISNSGATGTDSFIVTVRDEALIDYTNSFTPVTTFIPTLAPEKFAASALPLTQFPKANRTLTINVTLPEPTVTSSSSSVSASVVSSPASSLSSTLSSLSSNSIVVASSSVTANSSVSSSIITESSVVASSILPIASSSSSSILSSVILPPASSSSVISSIIAGVSSSSVVPAVSSSSVSVLPSSSLISAVSSPVVSSSLTSTFSSDSSLSSLILSSNSTSKLSSVYSSYSSSSSSSSSYLPPIEPTCHIANVFCPCWVPGAQIYNNYTVTTINENNTY
jgi:hypothetical protein